MADIVDVKNLDFIIDEQDESLDFFVDDFVNIASNNYNDLINKPQINGVTLVGNKTSAEIHVQEPIGDVTSQDIDIIIYG